MKQSNRYFNFTNYFNSDVNAILTKNHVDNFKKNVRQLAVDFNLDPSLLVIPDQVHSYNISIIKDDYNPFFTDGIITQNPKHILTLKVADCAPIYFEDASNNLRGLIHSGWRGTESKIIVQAIKMSQNLGSQLSNINFFIGPCISQEIYEVSSDVAEKFNSKQVLKKKNSYYLNLKGQITSDILSLGINLSQIRYSNICTYNSKECFSYRRQGRLSNRMYAFFWKQD